MDGCYREKNNQPKYAELCDHAHIQVTHFSPQGSHNTVEEGVRSQERMLQSYVLWTLMASQKPWLTARDLHKVKPVNIPAWRRKASPLGKELSATAEKGRKRQSSAAVW